MGRFSERLMEKLERTKDKLFKSKAKLASKMHTQRFSYANPITGKISQHKASSWIRSFTYEERTQTLYMTVHKGKTYSWDNVPPAIALKALQGQAACTTNDPTGKARWWIDKTPSLGAAFWQIMKPFRRSQQMNPPAIGGVAYLDIIDEVDPRYAITVKHTGRGRPTKSEEKAKFGWAGRYK